MILILKGGCFQHCCIHKVKRQVALGLIGIMKEAVFWIFPQVDQRIMPAVFKKDAYLARHAVKIKSGYCQCVFTGV